MWVVLNPYIEVVLEWFQVVARETPWARNVEIWIEVCNIHQYTVSFLFHVTSDRDLKVRGLRTWVTPNNRTMIPVEPVASSMSICWNTEELQLSPRNDVSQGLPYLLCPSSG